jgi:N-methylhydantoinase A
MRIGVDSGGTFTDFVVLRDDGTMETFKLLSNPAAPHEVILAGLRRACGPSTAEVIHGSTVATNALLERKGARTAFVTTAGFEDMLEIGRQARARLYDLTPGPKRLLVPAALCFGAGERSLPGGEIERRPTAAEWKRLRAALQSAGAESVAICFLHAYRAPDNERAALKALKGTGAYLSASHEVCPEFREYERASTTVLNAYVGPLMSRYLAQLAARSRHRIWIVQSNGGAITPGEAGRQAVRTLLSGPAGGVTGAMQVGRASGFRRVLGFDMGGTSTDVSLIDGVPRETLEASVDGLPVKLPMLEIHTVGAGGGSIARLDEGGLLRVGPESAGAVPGPACYGTGTLPTVTDAHVVLGRIAAGQLAGGSVPIEEQRARRAISTLARRMKLSAEETAEGIVRVANATMARAIRVVSVERGYDPRQFALVAFGGCGGLHACEIAQDLGIRTVLAPELAGSLSALGMLLSDRVRDYSAGAVGVVGLEPLFVELESRARLEMPGAVLERYADLRYQGQSYELTVSWQGSRTQRLFEQAHRLTYGYIHAGRDVEVVTVRVRARLKVKKPRIVSAAQQDDSKPGRRTFWSGGKRVTGPALLRAQVGARWQSGPALLIDYGSTLLAPAGWKFRREANGNVALRRA